MRVVGCFINNDKEFLLLYRSPNSRDAQVWGLPSGKVDSGETDIEAMIREINEETGITLDPLELRFLGEHKFVASSGKPSVFVAYETNLKERPFITLNSEEHTKYKWVTPKQANNMDDLIHGQLELFQRVNYI